MTVFGGPPGRDLDFLLILCDIFGIWTKKIEQLGSVTYLPPKLRYLNLPPMQLLMLQNNKYSFAFNPPLTLCVVKIRASTASTEQKVVGLCLAF